MNVQEQIQQIASKFNLDLSQIDDASNRAIDTLDEFLESIDYEVLEDGINILSTEDDIINISKGNYTSIFDFEKEANKRYITAFEIEAATV